MTGFGLDGWVGGSLKTGRSGPSRLKRLKMRTGEYFESLFLIHGSWLGAGRAIGGR